MSGTLLTSGGYRGAAWQNTGGNNFNAMSFLVNQILAGKAFAAMVQVKSVTGGGAGTPPIVSVQPMVAQINGKGEPTPHGTIYNIPCFRLQGGNGAIILDPAIGDIGQAIICDRDISVVKATGAPGTPGSWRQNDWADGCYFGGFLNAAPTQIIQFAAGGITITTPGTVTVNAASATVNATTSTFNGDIHASGSISAGGGVSDGAGSLGALRSAYDIHKHTGVTTGGGTTGPTDTPV
jgi:hypothetical protein